MDRTRLLPLFAFSMLVPFVAAQESTPVIDAVHKGHAVGHEQDGINAVRTALATGGKPTVKVHTTSPVRRERYKDCSFFHTYGVS